MKRVQLFEFEDFDWFPKPIRTSMTNLIVVFHKMMGTTELLTSLLKKVKEKQNFNQIVDMGSGSGGSMPEVIEHLNQDQENETNLLLTDLHPNPKLVQQVNEGKYKFTKYHPESFNATNLKDAPEGLKTMVNSFHHMPNEQAKKILLSAQENKQPLLIYEIGENNIPTLLWWIMLPISLTVLIIMTLFMTPFVKQLTWQQLVFTYLIPIIPICYAWDGQASLVRMYTFKDIEELLQGTETDDYHWEMDQAKKANGKKLGYYILGLPK